MSEAEPPREGLPPCVSVAVFEGRRAFMRDIRRCSHGWLHHEGAEQIVVVADTYGGSFTEPDEWHKGYSAPSGQAPTALSLWTSDPNEAKTAFERGAEWVRTGELE